MNFALLREMREAPELIRRFDPDRVAAWRDVIDGKRRVLITGEGSSRILPAHHLMACSRQSASTPLFWTCGAREACEYDLSDCAILCASNSGRTRELLDLLAHANARGVPSCALTATAGSPVTLLATRHVILSCGAEQAIAATKSVVEQTLVYQALLQGDVWQHQTEAADLCDGILATDAPERLVQILATATGTIYIAGRDDGVAEELALKTQEILRKKSVYLEGTLLLHGVEEVLEPNDVVVLIEPFGADMTRIMERIATVTPVIAITSRLLPVPAWRLPLMNGFNAYLQLMAGWQMLTAAARANGLDLDHARRARKAGNAV